MNRRDLLRSAVAGAAAFGGVSGRSRPRAATSQAVSDEYAPLGSVELHGAKNLVMGPDGAVGYVAVTDGFATVDVSDATGPTVLAERRELLADHENGPVEQIWDVKVGDDGERALVVGPANQQAGDPLRAALLYDVRDPADPEQVAVHETEYPIHNCALHDGYAYLTGNYQPGNPVVICSVEDDEFEEVARWSLFDHDEEWEEVRETVRPLHDVYVHDERVYLPYWDAGTFVLDVSDPADPEYVTHVADFTRSELAELDLGEARREFVEPPGNHHYARVDERGDLLAVGREAWADDEESDGGPGGITLWDISDERDPERLTTIEPPPTPDPTRGGVWTTAHNFDLADDRLYSSWYEGGVKIHDVSDPAEPVELAWWRSPEETSFWTAELAEAGGCVVAPDWGGFEALESATIYTFPDRPGEQPDPPSLTPGENTGASDETPMATPSPTPTPEKAAVTGTVTEIERGADGETPRGFGVIAALTGLGLAAWWRRR